MNRDAYCAHVSACMSERMSVHRRADLDERAIVQFCASFLEDGATAVGGCCGRSQDIYGRDGLEGSVATRMVYVATGGHKRRLARQLSSFEASTCVWSCVCVNERVDVRVDVV